MPREPLGRVAAALSLYTGLPRVTQTGRGARCSGAGGTRCPRPRKARGPPTSGRGVLGCAQEGPGLPPRRVQPPFPPPQNLTPGGPVPALKRSPVGTGAPVGPAPCRGVGRGREARPRPTGCGAGPGPLGAGRPRTLGHGAGRAGAERGGSARLGWARLPPVLGWRVSLGAAGAAQPAGTRGTARGIRAGPAGSAAGTVPAPSRRRRGWVRRAGHGTRGARLAVPGRGRGWERGRPGAGVPPWQRGAGGERGRVRGVWVSPVRPRGRGGLRGAVGVCGGWRFHHPIAPPPPPPWLSERVGAVSVGCGLQLPAAVGRVPGVRCRKLALCAPPAAGSCARSAACPCVGEGAGILPFPPPRREGAPSRPSRSVGCRVGAWCSHAVPPSGLREACLPSCGLQRSLETQDFHEDGICRGPWKRGWMKGCEA